MHSLYRRPLPPPLIAFASPAGRARFDAAREHGGMEAFFPLIEQFHTQADPAFCGLGSLVVVLNALGVDPGRLWKGPWRWFAEELLDCCSPLERVRARGVTIDELACLARCNGARAEVHRAGDHGVDGLREAVAAAAASPVDPALIASYDRGALGQTGSGHFSPIGGYDRASDHVLVLDVARFKYPPHWIPLTALHAAMQPLDPATGRARGWIALRRGDRPASLLFTARCTGDGDLASFAAALTGLRATLESAAPRTVEAALRAVLTAAAFPIELEHRPLALAEHAAAAAALLTALRATPVHAAVAAVSEQPDPDALLILALPRDLWNVLPEAQRIPWLEQLTNLPPTVDGECAHIRRQLADLQALAPDHLAPNVCVQ